MTVTYAQGSKHTEKRFFRLSFWSEHLLRLDPLLELFLVKVSQVDGLLLQSGPILVGGLGDFGCGVITDVRVQGCHQHQGLMEELADPVAVHFDTGLDGRTIN